MLTTPLSSVTSEDLYAMANELCNIFQQGTRVYEGLESFKIEQLRGVITQDFIGYKVEQPINVFWGVNTLNIVEKYRPEKPDSPNDAAFEKWYSYVSDTGINTALIGFRCEWPERWSTAYTGKIIRVIPYVDYAHINYSAYKFGSSDYFTLEELKRNRAHYIGILELMLAQL